MNASYAEYIETAQTIAAQHALTWNLDCDESGTVAKADRWNLTALTGMLPPPTHWLGQLGVDPASFVKLNEYRQKAGQPAAPARAMLPAWRDLYQAIIIYQLLVRKNKPGSAFQVALAVRQLAPATGQTPPWAVTSEHIQQAYNAVLASNPSGKVALNFVMMIRNVLDGQKLANTPALARFCVPYPTEEGRSAQRRADAVRSRQNAHGGGDHMRRALSERKTASKLPEHRAFWELVRIVFTETPQSFSDAIRFAALKLQIVMGFRISEVALLPVDWKRWREYFDTDGRPAARLGGISRSLMIRHFAEKHVEDERPEGLSFYENTQHVPKIFEDIILEILEHTEAITAPLRDRLLHQTNTGRIFPEYNLDAIVPAYEMYVRVTGNAVFSIRKPPPELVVSYRATLDVTLLRTIKALQLTDERGFAPLTKFWLGSGQRDIPIRTSMGALAEGNVNWSKAYIRVGDVEEHILKKRVTKLSDTSPAALIDGTKIYPHELLFIAPVRNLIEGRNGGILDTSLYAAIGRISSLDLGLSISGTGSGATLFERYGHNDDDRALRLTTHSLRHLQNAELFRLGVADTIITKKFNRRSVSQSYVYDHRSLAEDLADIDLGSEAEEALGVNALQIFRLITANKVVGPIVEEFRRVQREYGDDAAFDYLNAEADGLHVTPYGLCVNSFTVDPCPKHLECFNGCLHLARTDVGEEQSHLERMRDRMAKVITTINSVPAERRTLGWMNQIAHAQMRYDNVVKALNARPGEKPFPEGRDLSLSFEDKMGTSVLDSTDRW